MSSDLRCHDASCEIVSSTDQQRLATGPAGFHCVYWCEIGGLLVHLRAVTEALERNLAEVHPDRHLVAGARDALRRWST